MIELAECDFCTDTEDVDIHRYKCNVCNKIGYYSSAAADHYEGVKHNDWIVETSNRWPINRS